MPEWIVIAVLVAVIGYQGYMDWLHRKQAELTIGSLLDRVMAVEYAEFKLGQKDHTNMFPVDEEIVDALYEAKKRGAAVDMG